MDGSDLIALDCRSWKAKHAIEGPCKCDCIKEEECHEAEIRQKCLKRGNSEPESHDWNQNDSKATFEANTMC